MPYDPAGISEESIFCSEGELLSQEHITRLCETIYPTEKNPEFQRHAEWAQNCLTFFLSRKGKAVVETGASVRKCYPFPLLTSPSRTYRSEHEDEVMSESLWVKKNCVANVLVIFALLEGYDVTAITRLNAMAKRKRKSPFRCSSIQFTLKGIKNVWSEFSGFRVFQFSVAELVALCFTRENLQFFHALMGKPWSHIHELHLAFTPSPSPKDQDHETRRREEALRFLREEVTSETILTCLPSYRSDMWCHVTPSQPTQVTLPFYFLIQGPLSVPLGTRAIGHHFLDELPPWIWKGYHHEIGQLAMLLLSRFHDPSLLDQLFDRPVLAVPSGLLIAEPTPPKPLRECLDRLDFEKMMTSALEVYDVSPEPWKWISRQPVPPAQSISHYLGSLGLDAHMIENFLSSHDHSTTDPQQGEDVPLKFELKRLIKILKKGPAADHPIWTLSQTRDHLNSLSSRDLCSLITSWVLFRLKKRQSCQQVCQEVEVIFPLASIRDSKNLSSILLLISCLELRPKPSRPTAQVEMLWSLASWLLDQNVQLPSLEFLTSLGLSVSPLPVISSHKRSILLMISLFFDCVPGYASIPVQSIWERYALSVDPLKFPLLTRRLFFHSQGLCFLQNWITILSSLQDDQGRRLVKRPANKLITSPFVHLQNLWILLLGQMVSLLSSGELSSDNNDFLDFVLDQGRLFLAKHGPHHDQLEVTLDKTTLLSLPPALLEKLLPSDFTVTFPLLKRQRI